MIRGRVALIVPLIWFVSLPVAAQSPASVDLGSDITIPGEVSRIPLTLAAEGAKVTAIEDQVTFPAALSFVDVELGDAGTVLSAKVETKVTDSAENPASRKLAVTIVAPEGKVFSSGVVAILRFTVPKDIDTSGSTDLKLEHQPSVVDSNGGKQRVKGTTGTVSIMTKPPPLIVCFFYMH